MRKLQSRIILGRRVTLRHEMDLDLGTGMERCTVETPPGSLIPLGLFEYTVMAMSLKGASTCFQK